MMLFWIFLTVNVFVIGVFYAVYGVKRTYSEGMLMGVHIPRSAAESEEVAAIMKQYRKLTKWFYLGNAAVSSVVCLLNFWYVSVFVIVWMIWLVEMCAGGMLLVYWPHRKLYKLKVERGWIGSGGSRIMAADTKVGARSGKMGLPVWWHSLFLFFILLPCLLPGVRKCIRTSEEGLIFFLSALAVWLVFAALHAVILRTRNRVYSEDSDRNLEINQMQKNAWSWSLAGCGLFNAFSYLFIAGYMDDGKWIDAWAYTVYFVLQSVPLLFLIAGMAYIRVKKPHLLAEVESPLYIDDDVYWKNGWYSNPNDKRLIVQDWVCPYNYTTNMARPAAKVFLVLTVVFAVGLFIFVAAMLAKFELTPIHVMVTRERVEVTSGYTDVTLSYDEIQDIDLLDRLPDEEYKKINGGDSDKMLVGKFRGEESGNCRLYLYTGCEPILKISTADGPVYVNSRNDREAAKWYRQIEKNLGR